MTESPAKPKPKRKTKRRRRKSPKSPSVDRTSPTQAADPSSQAGPVKGPPKPKPWERQLRETPKAFAAFQKYLDLGRLRTIRQVLDVHLKPDGKPAANLRQLEYWSSQWKWGSRAGAYEDALWKQTLGQRARAVEESREAYIKALPSLVQRGVAAALGQVVKLTSPQVSALSDALDRAGLIVEKKVTLGGLLGVFEGDPPEEPEEDYGNLTAAEIEKRYSELTKQTGQGQK